MSQKQKTNFTFEKAKLFQGFTLIELLVVISIIGILATIGLSSYQSSQMKARDGKRKSDLRQIGNALEAYFSDHNLYPLASGGKIKACGCTDTPSVCGWGEGKFCDENETVYMVKVPSDPKQNPDYCYWSDGTSYKLYAKLENTNDPEATLSVSCAGEDYNFGISSSNTTP